MQPNPGQPPAAEILSIPQPQRPRLLPWVGGGLVFVVALTAIPLWYRARAPQVVRMTPPGTTLVYLNLKPLRQTGWLTAQNLPGGVVGDGAADYTAFVQGSGFDFTRDLDALACSVQGAPLRPSETTCVLAGRFGTAFTSWLRANARAQLRLTNGQTAYQFPGWAQPQRPMFVIPVDGRLLIATNTSDPAAVAGGREQTPALWQSGFGSAPPMGYVAVNVEELAATRQLDGTEPPWRGAQTLHARVRMSAMAGVRVSGSAQMGTVADAAAAQAWAQQEMIALEGELPAGAGGRLSVRGLLQRLQVHQNGREVQFGVTVEPGVM